MNKHPSDPDGSFDFRVSGVPTILDQSQRKTPFFQAYT